MKRLSILPLIAILAAAAIHCPPGIPDAAVLPPPPECKPSADICERLPWIEHVLWSREEEAIPHLRAMAAGDAHDRVRERSLGALAIIRDTGGQNVFLGRLASDPSPAVRRAAAEGIGLLKFPGPQPHLTECLEKDAHPLVRAECARALGRMEKLTSAPFLAVALLRDPSPEVRALSAEALAHLRTPEAIEPLRQGAKDDDPIVRLYAIRGLVESDPSSSLPLFRQVWETTDDPELRAEAFRGLLVSESFEKWKDSGLADKDDRIRFLALQEWVARLSRRKGGIPMLDADAIRRIESFLSDPARGNRELAKSFLEKQGYRVRPSGFRYILDR